MTLLVYFAIPAFILLQILEAVVIARHRGAWDVRGYETRDTAASLTMGVGNVLINLGTKPVAVAIYAGLHELSPLSIGWTWWAWPLLFVTEDLCYYWFHRCHHEVRFLWAAHVNHHSSQRYNLSTALRQPWTTPFTGPLFWTPLALLGFEPIMILTAQSVSLLYQFWIHTETIGTLGPLEWVLNTPSHHRVHHGRNVRYLDRNHGGILIVWDRLFGTFEPERERVDYGLTKNIHTFNPFRIAFHEWWAMLRDTVRATRWADRLAYLVRAPGWSPDGSTLTAREMQARL